MLIICDLKNPCNPFNPLWLIITPSFISNNAGLLSNKAGLFSNKARLLQNKAALLDSGQYLTVKL